MTLESAVKPSTTTLEAGAKACLNDEPAAVAAVSKNTDEEPAPLSNTEIHLVFLAYVCHSFTAPYGADRICRLSVAAFLDSLDQTIIATAMPTIASEYDALPQQSCMFSAILLAAR